MDEQKLKNKLEIFTRKISERDFNSSDFSDFFISVRWEEGINNIMVEISHFLAHQTKDRGFIYDKLQCWKIISNFIEEDKLKQVDGKWSYLSFPKDVFEAISLLYGAEIKKFYRLKNGNYTINKKGKNHSKRVVDYFNSVFLVLDFQNPVIIKREDLYIGFVELVLYLQQKHSLENKLIVNEIDDETKDEIVLCIASVLNKSEIKIKEFGSIVPYFKVDNDRLNLRYKNYAKHPKIFISFVNGSGFTSSFCDINLDSSIIDFSDGKTELIRNKDKELVFR